MIQRLLEPYGAESSSVGSEYFINSQELEDKVRKVLPSQGGAGAGFDLSASTQIIPIIDLTESAEGSNVREDLQTALSFNSITTFTVTGATSTLISNTGYYRVFGNFNGFPSSSAVRNARFALNDGTTDKFFQDYNLFATSNLGIVMVPFDFIVFLPAGHSLKATTNVTQTVLEGCFRQIADINGDLVNP